MNQLLLKHLENLPTLTEIKKERSKRSLKQFIHYFWPYIDPAKYVDNWHIDAICEHLQAVASGEIKRLIINVPPRHMKSILVSVAYPVWKWLHDPSHRFLTGSYGLSLSTRLAVASRRVVESPLYQNMIKTDGWNIRSDQNQKQYYETTKGGYRLVTSVGGSLTGEGGDTLILDDPHNVEKQVLSKTDRESSCQWYDSAFSTRLNDPEKSSIIIIMQRLHEKDICGHVSGIEHWEKLILPAEYEGKKKPICTGWEDPRTQQKELLWPARVTAEVLEGAKKRLGAYGYAGQYQQRPAPLEGSMIDLAWFKRYQFAPADIVGIFQFWDTAQKDNEINNDPWVCGTWAMTYDGFYLLDVFRNWMTYPEGKKKVVELAEKYNPTAIMIEDKSTGSSLLQEIKGYPLVAYQPEGDKIARMAAQSAVIEGGKVHIPDDAPWMLDFTDEVSAFPKSDHDDQVDMLSMSLKYLQKRSRPVKVLAIGSTQSSNQDW